MQRQGILVGAFALAGCSPPTEPVGSVGTTSGVGGSGDDSDAAGETAQPGSSSSSAAEPDTSGGDLPSFDMGTPDLPAQQCNEEVFCDPSVASPVVLSGMAPSGPVELDYALWGPGRCACWSLEWGISFELSSDPLDPPDEDHPTIDRLFFPSSAEPGPQGTQVARFYRDGTLELVDYTMELTMVPTEPLSNDMRVVATFEITEPGWDLQGTIDAALCYEVGFQIPCD